jgi:hypothetical protein
MIRRSVVNDMAGTLLFHQLSSALGACGPDNPHPCGAGKLHCGDTHTSARTMHKDILPRDCACTIEQGSICGAIRNSDTRPLGKRDVRGQGEDP